MIYYSARIRINLDKLFTYNTEDDTSTEINHSNVRCDNPPIFKNSPDGSTMVFSYSNKILVFSTSNNEILFEIKRIKIIRDVCFSTDGSKLVILYEKSFEYYDLIENRLIYRKDINIFECKVLIHENLLVLYDNNNVLIINLDTEEVILNKFYNFYNDYNDEEDLDETRNFYIYEICFNEGLNKFIMYLVQSLNFSDVNVNKIFTLDFEPISSLSNTSEDYNKNSLFFNSGNKLIILYEKENNEDYFKIFDTLTGECLNETKITGEDICQYMRLNREETFLFINVPNGLIKIDMNTFEMKKFDIENIHIFGVCNLPIGSYI